MAEERRVGAPTSATERWSGYLEELHTRIARRFRRPEVKERLRHYLAGLLAEIRPKNSWQMAEVIGETQPRGTQRILGGCVTEADGRQWKLGEEGLQRGQLRWVRRVRCGLYHGRPRDLFTNVALCWRIPKSRARAPGRKHPEEPWYLATSVKDAQSAASWYWQRGWIEQSFKDSKGRFGLARVRVSCPKRLGRLLIALTVALGWLTLMGLPEVGVMPRGWQAAVAQRGRASVISLALALLDKLGNLPPTCVPPSSPDG